MEFGDSVVEYRGSMVGLAALVSTVYSLRSTVGLAALVFLSLTERTDCTELTLRVPSGFDLSPTDDTDCSDSFFSFFLMSSFLALPKTLLYR